MRVKIERNHGALPRLRGRLRRNRRALSRLRWPSNQEETARNPGLASEAALQGFPPLITRPAFS